MTQADAHPIWKLYIHNYIGPGIYGPHSTPWQLLGCREHASTYELDQRKKHLGLHFHSDKTRGLLPLFIVALQSGNTQGFSKQAQDLVHLFNNQDIQELVCLVVWEIV